MDIFLHTHFLLSRMLKLHSRQRGATMIEFLTVIALIVLLTGFIVVSLGKTQQHVSVNTTADQLVADIKQQQLKSMINDTEGRGTSSAYGIHFDSDKYTLFHGLVFTQGDPGNFVVNLDSGLQFSDITFPGFNIIFATQSGEFVGYANGKNTVKILNTSGGNNKTITVNSYGAVTGVN